MYVCRTRLVAAFFIIALTGTSQAYSESGQKKLSGQAAIDHLGTRLDKFAAKHHFKSTKEFKNHMVKDSTLKLHVLQEEFLLYVEALGPQKADGADGSASSGPVSIAPVVPPYSSRPNARHTIYLDFDGHVTENTNWNSYFNNPSIVSPPYNTDGDATTFSAAELTDIKEAWQRISEDFAQFDVNVTTVEPSASDLIKTDASDTRWGVRTVITLNNVGCGCGGIAYVGSFNWNSDMPVFVYTTSAKYVAEAASHEIGHSLGLSHDGTTTGSAYYAGHGSGETGWAPIMGVGYYQNTSQWSKGEYPAANNTQDDLQIITTQNGFGYRSDDHGNTIGSATAVALVNSNAVMGVIENSLDTDLFKIVLPASGILSVGAVPFWPGPNLDIKLEVLDADGAVLSTMNTMGKLAAGPFNSSVLPSGTYYLRVQGDGNGDPLAGGYTNYGSEGKYSIGISYASDSASLAPVASFFSSGKKGAAPFTIHYDAFPSFSANGLALSYSWDFGDGSTASGRVVSHQFNDNLPHLVTLTVTEPDANGGHSGSYSEEVNPPSSCQVAAPTLALSPSTLALKLGATVVYTGSLLNNDGAECSSSNFNLSGVVPAGWSGVINSPTLALSPGTSQSFSFAVTSPLVENEGNFAIGVTVNRSGAVGASASAWAKIDSTPPSSITNLAAVLKKNGTVVLSWSAASDSGTGLAYYQVVRNGVVIANANTASYTDTKPLSGTNSYVVKPVDGAGNSSSSNTVSVTVGGSSGGGGKGGRR